MGKIERLVVVGVVALIVVILAVTFSPTEEELERQRHRELARVEESNAKFDSLDDAKPVHIDTERVKPLDLHVDPVQPAVHREGAMLSTAVTLKPKVDVPEGSILVATAGLEDSYLDDFKIYEPKTGETYASIAELYYGDAGQAWLLRRYNEGQPAVVAGKEMFVPVYLGVDDVEVADEPVAAEGETYVVREDDSLWEISAEVYGSGASWKKIHEANLDVIPNAHSLKPGIVLQIPR